MRHLLLRPTPSGFQTQYIGALRWNNHDRALSHLRERLNHDTWGEMELDENIGNCPHALLVRCNIPFVLLGF